MSVVFLTGASRGIGRATALALAARGCDLALPGRPSEALDATLADARKHGVRVLALPCDLADVGQVEVAVRRGIAELGSPDVLVNNAGVIERASVEETTTSAWDLQLAVNLRAPFVLTREVLPAMRAAGRGRIVNVGSISSTLGTARSAAYNASKWGIVGFTKSLAEELSGTGLMTVAVLPGSVDTRMLNGSGFTPRMSAADVATTLVYCALDAPLAHNGGVIELFGT